MISSPLHGHSCMGHNGLSFLGGRLPEHLALRVFVLPPGACHAYRPAEWRDALVVVERGEIELETCSGRRWRFRCGEILSLADLPLQALHNPGSEATLLAAVSRRCRSK
jgi:hypothetical protein